VILGTPSRSSVDGTVKPVLNTHVYMGETEYRNVRLTEEAYRRLESRKQPGESFSDTVERLAGERSLLDLAGILSEEDAEGMREAIRESEDRSRERLDRLTERLDP
jgi:predicted CopG family antitoxin